MIDSNAQDRQNLIDAHTDNNTNVNPSTADGLIKKDTSIVMSDGNQRPSFLSGLGVHRTSSRYSGAFSNNAAQNPNNTS